MLYSVDFEGRFIFVKLYRQKKRSPKVAREVTQCCCDNTVAGTYPPAARPMVRCYVQVAVELVAVEHDKMIQCCCDKANINYTTGYVIGQTPTSAS